MPFESMFGACMVHDANVHHILSTMCIILMIELHPIVHVQMKHTEK